MSFRDEYKNNLKLQACLSRFIPMFAAASRKNQTLIANGFISVMNMLKVLYFVFFLFMLVLQERDLESDLTSISEISLAESVLKLTSYNVLLNDATDKFVCIIFLFFITMLRNYINNKKKYIVAI